MSRQMSGLPERMKRAFAWSWIRNRAPKAGVEPADLDRFQHYLDYLHRVAEPPYTHPLQRPKGYFPGLTAKPWHEPAEFEWTWRLEEGHEAIKQEFLDVHSLGSFQAQPQRLADRGQWNVYHFYYQGLRMEENCRRCPRTTHIIDSIPGTGDAGLVYFSVLAPNSHVTPHCGPTNTRLRCHLGLVVPPGCQIRVGLERRSWEEGKCLLLDDSFEHEAWNSSGESRAVLILDFWHPELTAAEIWALARAHEMSTLARKLRRRR